METKYYVALALLVKVAQTMTAIIEGRGKPYELAIYRIAHGRIYNILGGDHHREMLAPPDGWGDPQKNITDGAAVTVWETVKNYSLTWDLVADRAAWCLAALWSDSPDASGKFYDRYEQYSDQFEKLVEELHNNLLVEINEEDHYVESPGIRDTFWTFQEHTYNMCFFIEALKKININGCYYATVNEKEGVYEPLCS